MTSKRSYSARGMNISRPLLKKGTSRGREWFFGRILTMGSNTSLNATQFKNFKVIHLNHPGVGMYVSLWHSGTYTAFLEWLAPEGAAAAAAAIAAAMWHFTTYCCIIDMICPKLFFIY